MADCRSIIWANGFSLWEGIRPCPRSLAVVQDTFFVCDERTEHVSAKRSSDAGDLPQNLFMNGAGKLQNGGLSRSATEPAICGDNDVIFEKFASVCLTTNLESSRSPRTRVCSQIEDSRGDYSNVGRSLRLTWLKVWEKYLGGGVQMAARRAFEWGYRGRSSFEKGD